MTEPDRYYGPPRKSIEEEEAEFVRRMWESAPEFWWAEGLFKLLAVAFAVAVFLLPVAVIARLIYEVVT